MTESRFRPVKAYKNESFIASSDARPLRILAEYVEPQTRFRELRVRDTIVFFGSARFVPRETAEAQLAAARAGEGDLARAQMLLNTSRYYEDTRELTYRLTHWSKKLTESERRFLVCSGGAPRIIEGADR